MKQSSRYLILAVCFTVMLPSCKNEKSHGIGATGKPVAAVGDEKIYMSDIDKNISKKLYDVLFQVYLMRKAAVDSEINRIIIEKEAAKKNLTPDKFLETEVYKEVNKPILNKFSVQCRYDKTGIPVLNNTLQYIDVNSPRGQMLLEEKYKQYKLEAFIDKNKKKYQIQSYLMPPESPLANLSGIDAMFRGNKASKFTVWIMTDIENQNCRNANVMYDALFQKYQNKVRFAYVNYSGDITPSGMALECARRQNKFWEMYRYLSRGQSARDLASIVNNVGLDKKKFMEDYQDPSVSHSIIKTINQLNYSGFWGVPSVVVNNKVILDVYSRKTIENAIDKELAKTI